ncbi:MAG: SpoIIE family protein phosphatase [Leptospira sp.]|nr:SpoIIE family protein phosphatase [Leptospira sp.]
MVHELGYVKNIFYVCLDSQYRVVESNLGFNRVFSKKQLKDKNWNETIRIDSLIIWNRFINSQFKYDETNSCLLWHQIHGHITEICIRWESMGWEESTNGKTISLVGVDQTHSIFRKKNLKRNIEFQQTFIDSTKSIIFLKDLNGRYKGLNRAMESLLNLPKESILGKTDEEILDPEIGKLIRDSEIQVLETLESYPTLEKFNEELIFEFTRFPIFEDERLSGLGGIGFDVTMQVDSQINLSQKIEENKAIISAIPDLVFILDSNYVFIDYNSDKDSSLLMAPKDFLGKTIYECLPTDLAKKTERMMSMAKFEDNIQVIEYSLMIGNERKYYEARCIFFSKNKFLFLVRDISDVKKKSLELQNDLNMARDLQFSTLPKPSSLQQKYFGLSIIYKPFSHVSGDIYDFYELSQGCYRFMVVDAVGHGIQSSLLTMAMRTEMERIKPQFNISPGDLLTILNQSLIATFKNSENTCTCLVIDIDFLNHRIIYSTAGHPNQLYKIDGGLPLPFGMEQSPLIGMIDGFQFKEKELTWADEFEIFLFTDGAYEYLDKNGNIFTEENFSDLIGAISHNLNSKNNKMLLSTEVYSAILEIASGNTLRDDLTFLHIFSK